MTETIVVFLTGAFVGAAGSSYAAARMWRRWAEEHHYRAVAISGERLRALAEEADREHRLRLKAERAARQGWRDQVGDLLDRVVDLERKLRLRARPRLAADPGAAARVDQAGAVFGVWGGTSGDQRRERLRARVTYGPLPAEERS